MPQKRQKINKPSILLTYPPASLVKGWGSNPFPMTQLLLASFLEFKGLGAGIYQELPYSIPHILARVKKLKFAAVGMTCDCANLDSCAELAVLIKKANKDTVVILGGVHATLYHREILETFPQIDIVVRGEGEEALAQIMGSLNNPGRGIKGIAFRKKGAVVVTPERSASLDCDRLPPLSYHLLGKTITRDFDYVDKWWPLHTGRGCAYNCAYCSSGRFWKHCYRVKSVQRIIEEIRRCQKEYQVRAFAYDDLVFSVDRQRTILLCEEILRAGLTIEWCCDTRIDRVDRELLVMMYKAGCRRIVFGVESFSTRVLKLMNKNYDGDKALEIVNFASSLGIDVKCQFIFGFPGENERTLQETMNRIRQLKKGVFCNPILFHMYSGSDIYDKARRKGMIDDRQWMRGYGIDDFTKKYYPQPFLQKLGGIRNSMQKQFKPYAANPVPCAGGG